MRKHWLLFFCLLLSASCFAQQATWIWYPGDYEIWLNNNMQNRRTDRGAFFPVFWKVDSHYPLMDFHKVFDLKEPEEVRLATEGQYNIKIDGRLLEGTPTTFIMPAGKHKLNVKVFNQAAVPAIWVQGKTIASDSSWLVTFEDKEWIDETGKTSDISATNWLSAGSWNFNDPLSRPSQFQLPVSLLTAVSVAASGNERLYDFGRETFGFVKIHGLKGKGPITLYYGESKEEALSKEGAVAYDRIDWTISGAKANTQTSLTKAFRYINVVPAEGMSFDSISVLYEYAPVAQRGRFRSSDALINRIYDVSNYTLQLNTREFFIDGIKRDRWVWSGDAYQSYLMNYYSFFDNPTVKRTIYALRGKDPVTAHINTIMDYTFYWFLGIYDYYQYSGDSAFLTTVYPRMQSLMQYVLGRRNPNGLLEGQPGDWIFIDWAEGLSKKGEVSFEQLLFARSLETMALCARLVGDGEGEKTYSQLSEDMKKKLFQLYWNEEKGALVHSRVDGRQTENVTRYANMFGIFFNYFTEAQKQKVKRSVLLNDRIQKISTPYMRFYELEALCAMGEQDYVMKEMRAYWGGMLNLGATTFWEEYNPARKGAEHYAMYGREFGKSLCHAWGASPIYLLGRYYLGVAPAAPGYAAYTIQPRLGDLQWMEGAVPTPGGDVEIYCSRSEMRIKGATGIGTLLFASAKKPSSKDGTIEALGEGRYQMKIEKGKTYQIKYSYR